MYTHCTKNAVNLTAQLDMACAELKQLINNPFAIERYIASKMEHPGWAEMRKKSSRRMR